MSRRFARRFLLAAAFVTLPFLAGLASPLTARAQAAPPMGRWATSDHVEELDVFSNGCQFLVRGRTQVAGRCDWFPSSRGGILRIIYPMPLEPGKIRYNIVWVNKNTITVWGDVMHRLDR